MLLTMFLRGTPSLCIFGRPYSRGALEPDGCNCLLQAKFGAFVLHVAFACIWDESHLLKCLSQLHLVVLCSSIFAQDQKIFRNTNLKSQLHRKCVCTCTYTV
jgi:hypothetical protein